MHGTENQNQARLIPKQATSLANVCTEFCRLAALAATRPGAGVGGSGQAGEQGADVTGVLPSGTSANHSLREGVGGSAFHPSGQVTFVPT